MMRHDGGPARPTHRDTTEPTGRTNGTANCGAETGAGPPLDAPPRRTCRGGGGRGLPPAGLSCRTLPDELYLTSFACRTFVRTRSALSRQHPSTAISPPTPRDRVRHQGRPSGPVLGPDRTGICTTRIRPARRTPACPPLSKPLLTSTSRMRACTAGGRTAAALRQQNRTVLSRGLSPAHRSVLISERPS